MLDTPFMLWELSVTEQRYRAVLEVLAGVPVTEVAGRYGCTAPLLGAVHDLTAARIWGIIRESAASGLIVLGDKGYLGEDHIRTPYRGGNKPTSQKAPTARARLRAPAKCANVQLTSWRILRKAPLLPQISGRCGRPAVKSPGSQ